MNLAYASDLHLEFNAPLSTAGLSDTEVLILAGDVETRPAQYTRVLYELRQVYSGPVIFVLGNHEYYNGFFPADLQKYRKAIAHDRQAFLLEKESLLLGGVRFLGATLWTDFASGTQMRNCQRMMSDFQVIQNGVQGSLTPERVLEVHRDSVAWLNYQFTNHSHDGPTVVITHHAPSFRSQHPRFAGSPISGGFCSDLDHYIQHWRPAIWIHGHLHDPVQYRIGETQVLCNPWGYPSDGLRREYAMVEVTT